jgi:single-strand DNA-binding protein
MINKLILVGHVGGDPDIRRTQDGRKLATFSIATAQSWRDKATGERKERTEWHRVVVFNEALAEVVEKYVKKGSKLYVEGALISRSYVDKDKVTRKVFECVLQGFQSQLLLLDRAARAPDAPPPGDASDYGELPGSAPASPAPRTVRDDLDDEVPF